ncbi:endonuclease domain-containing protein [Phenylobacterium sp.]|jgi:very-short-patch-repair endonuclease|uniref:endonuclease domain-containing protein n=1 Tax=Phenylobacterium sp. TaxID=1871053 RepID=UPI002E334C72|nr:DUF559 domain-containing protein [Phenylobacterium sp.]HEX3363772.1 DUF559 domain-containing protein [Phenylobacterium sp.]
MDSNASLKIVKRARALRKAMTEPEVMLWSKLKGRGRGQPIFRRQFAYESMIFDFYRSAAKLAVEIDGSMHWPAEKRAKDEARDRWLARRGIEVLRIGAGAVYQDLGGAADAVVLRALALIESHG